jgi:O-antigen/teichoic acid export membrane protein
VQICARTVASTPEAVSSGRLSESRSTDSGALSRLPLPEGTLPVGLGLLVAGVASYAFFKVGVWAVGGEEEFKPISSLWFATFALAPGFFLPLEQEVGRALAHRKALGHGGQPVVRRVATLGLILTVIVTIALLAASPFITNESFGGNWVMFAALVIAFAAYAPAHLSRGICSGEGRFTDYAIVMGGDGLARIILCLILAVAGVTAVGPYGFAVAAAPLIGVALVAKRGALRTDSGPEATWDEVTPNLGWLLLGSVLAAALVNAGPLVTDLLAPANEDDLVTQFSYGVLMARVPLFLFQAVQAALLPRLARLAAEGDMSEFRLGFKRLMVVVTAVGLIGVVGAYALGPPVIKRVYDADLSNRTLGMLAFGSACYMVATATAQAVIALKGHALVALGWVAGMIGFVVATWLSGSGPTEVFKRVEIGLVVGPAIAGVVFFFALRHKLDSGATIDPESLLDAIADRPLDG